MVRMRLYVISVSCILKCDSPGLPHSLRNALQQFLTLPFFYVNLSIDGHTSSCGKKKLNTFMFIAALFTIAQIWKQPKCPSVDE